MSTVQSVERSWAILSSLAVSEAGVSELAGRVGLPKSTVSRLLTTLHELDVVTPTEDGYRIGPLIAAIAAGAGRHEGLAALARPYLSGLVDALGEDAGVSVLDEGDVLYLDQVGSNAAVQLRDWTGERVPPHTVPSGLVMLAYADEAERERVLAGTLARFTDKTMVSPPKLRRRLGRITGTGTEWVYGEFSDDINSVAAPVFDGGQRAIAAIHVHGPAYRFPGDRDPAVIADAVSDAARRLSGRLTR